MGKVHVVEVPNADIAFAAAEAAIEATKREWGLKTIALGDEEWGIEYIKLVR